MTDAASPAPAAVPRLGPLGRTRIALAGIALPVGLAALPRTLSATWSDLPDEFPSHWGPDGADAFLPIDTYVGQQSIAAFVVAAITVCLVAVYAWGWRWSTLGRGICSVGVGVTAAISLGLVVQLSRARGLSVEGVVDLGAGAGVLGVFGGFALFTAIAVMVFPRVRTEAHPGED